MVRAPFVTQHFHVPCISKVPCLPHFLGFGRVRGGAGGVLVSGLLCGINLEVCFMLVRRGKYSYSLPGVQGQAS